MKPNEIWLAKHMLDKARREFRRAAMVDFDTNIFYPKWNELIARCESNGHDWQFSSFNLGGNAIYRCACCGTSKVVKEDDDAGSQEDTVQPEG